MIIKRIKMMDSEMKKAFYLIMIFGAISLFGDIVYEGARSVNGSYLAVIGVNAVTVGLIAGIGEFLGYFIRLISGYFADKTKAYWVFTITGYMLLISVPLLSLTDIWQIAGVFIVMERIGKALRSPAKDTILSHAAHKLGRGFGFGLHEAMDQLGALIGPLIFTVVFMFFTTGEMVKSAASYKIGYSLLWIPFLLTIFCVLWAFTKVPNPEKLEKNTDINDKLGKTYWLYLLFTILSTTGFISYAIVAFHLKSKGIVADYMIPVLYAVAMVIDGITAVIVGRIYDKKGIFVIFIIPVFTLFITPLVFATSFILILAGAVVWGIVMGTHETIMKAAVADLTSIKKRGTGYGVFNTGYGIAMLAGTAAAGVLYELNIYYLIIFSVVFELLSISVLIYMWNLKEKSHG